MQEEISSIFAKFLPFVLILLLLSSNCSGSSSGIKDGDDHKDREDGSSIRRWNTAGDAHPIQLQFNSHGKVTPIHLYAYSQNYTLIRILTSLNLLILCTFTNYETAISTGINAFAWRAEANVLCVLPAKLEAATGSECSASYMYHHMYEIAYEKSDRVRSLSVTFDSNSRNQAPNAGRIVEMAATLLCSTSKPLHYHKRLKIGVPVRSIFRQFVKINMNHNETQVIGFGIEFFEADTAATWVYVKPHHVFLFMAPFTNEMWFILTAMTVFNFFVILLVESTTDGGLPFRQVGAIFWFPLATLFYGGHRESPKNNLTYFVLAPWFILILLVTSTYTATFTSMITSSETKSSCWLDMQILKQTNAIVGCDMEDSVMFQHLVEVLGFQRKSIKHIGPQSSIDDYAEALSTGNIKAAFFWAQHVGFFLAKYCEGFGGPNCNLRSSSVIIPRDSPFVHDFSEAMLGLRRSGSFKQRKDDMLYFQDCLISQSDGTIKQGIGPKPFSGLFILSSVASGIAMLITVIRVIRRRWESFVQGMLIGRGLWVWLTTLFSLNQRENQLQLQLPRGF